MKKRNLNIEIIEDDLTNEITEQTKEHKCFWLNKKGKPCPWNSLSSEKNYCKRHSIYEEKYTPNDIPFLTNCSGCKNMFKDEPEFKQCLTCRTRYKKNQDKITKKRCLGFTQNKTQCNYEPNDMDDYCEKHQTYKKWKELIDSGKNVCKNWNTGCFNIIKSHEKYCDKCKTIINTNKKINYNKKKNFAEEYNEIDNINKMCKTCNVVDKKENLINDKCARCYENYKKSMDKKYSVSESDKRLKKYKKYALDNEIEWKFTDEEFKKIIEEKCYYCSEIYDLNEIVRINTDESYNKANCITCCKTCLDIINNESEILFMKRVKIILANNLLIEEDVINNEKDFKVNSHSPYLKFRNNCEKTNIKFEISELIYNKILKKSCIYCNNFQLGANGLSLIDGEKGFVIGNIEPCCFTCENMKKKLSHSSFVNKLKKIYDYKIKNIQNNGESLKNKIIELCKKIKPVENQIFKNEPKYYEKLIYKNKNISDVIKIKIELEFVENETQKDIWNYYRRTVSSLKIYENNKILGRQIYILVKDNISQKYLGILSLSSDNYNYEDRDRYIGWSYKDKKKLHHLMNISTCVPLQPFGFNFNGGKLLACLAFSKEILKYFNDKYNDQLLGITTTSLYGKSIQYDRLKCLKFVGFTKGNTSHGVSTEITKLCNDYLKEFSNNKSTYNKKFIILHKTFDKLNIPKDDILTTNPKGIYFGFTCPESKNYLCGNTEKTPNPLKHSQNSIQQIFDWWINRWAKQRYEHLKLNNKLNDY